MRRSLALCAVVLVACAKTDKAADTTTPAAATPPAAAPAPLAIADLAGTWEGTAMPMGKDTVLTTATMTMTGTMDGNTMKLPNGETPAVKVIAVEGDSIVSESGPYASATRKGQKVSTHSILHLKDGKLVGVTHAKWANGDTATLRMEFTKKP